MRLLRLQEVQISSSDRMFRHPRLRALIGLLVALTIVAALFYRAYTDAKWKPGYIFGSISAALHTANAQVCHRPFSSIELAGAHERNRDLRAVSLLFEL